MVVGFRSKGGQSMRETKERAERAGCSCAEAGAGATDRLKPIVQSSLVVGGNKQDQSPFSFTHSLCLLGVFAANATERNPAL